MALKYRYIEVDIMDLLLDPENPRFASSELVKKSGDIPQKVIVAHLLKYSKVGELANRINRIKSLHGGDLITCYEKNGKYIVLEGNRRVCACKLLLNSDLIPDRYKSEFPVANEETKNNIKKIFVSLYTDRESVQAYLSDRHIKVIEKWSSFEKQNYYMNLFSEFKDIKEVARFTSDPMKTIKKSIIKYQFFMEVFNVLKSQYPDISIEKMDYLPLVNRFMNTLIGNDSEVGLSLCLDESNLKYYCDNTKRVLYNKILLLIGEAFLLRKEKRKSKPGELAKIVSTELNTILEQKNIITNNIRIPGLFRLIKEYKGILDNDNAKEGAEENPLDNNSGGKEGAEGNPLDNNSGGKEGAEGNLLDNNSGGKEGAEGNPLDNNSSGKEGAGENPLNNDNVMQQPITQSRGFRPTKTLKNFLCFTDQEASKFKIYGDTNYELKIKSLIYDLSSFPVYKHPYTCALLYRALLESTTKLVFERYKKNISFKYTEDKLVDNLIYLNDNFLFNNAKSKDMPKIRKAIKKNLTTSNIVDILNLYIHYGYPVDVALLLSSWNTMKVFIATCLEK